MTGIRVLYVIGQLERGGAEQHLVRLVPALREHGIAGEVFVFQGGGPLESVLREAGVPVHVGVNPPPANAGVAVKPGRAARLRRLLSVVLRLRRVLRRLRPHVVHYFLPESYVVGATCALLSIRAKHVMSRRSLNRYQQGRPLIRLAERILHRHMDLVLGNSQAVVRDLLAEGVPPERVGLIYNGVEIPEENTPAARREARAALGLEEDEFVGLTVANLIAYKGHADLLEALSIVRDSMPPRWRWLMVGRDDGCLAGLQARAEQLGVADRIVWAGEQASVATYYRAADLLVHPSHQEGLSNAILEAMSHGLPVVATDVGGNRELLGQGAAATLVPVATPSGIGSVLAKIAADAALRSALGTHARLRIERSFNWSALLREYCDIYKALCAEGTGVQDCNKQAEGQQ